jgi:hypothetical protein
MHQTLFAASRDGCTATALTQHGHATPLKHLAIVKVA